MPRGEEDRDVNYIKAIYDTRTRDDQCPRGEEDRDRHQLSPEDCLIR